MGVGGKFPQGGGGGGGVEILLVGNFLPGGGPLSRSDFADSTLFQIGKLTFEWDKNLVEGESTVGIFPGGGES